MIRKSKTSRIAHKDDTEGHEQSPSLYSAEEPLPKFLEKRNTAPLSERPQHTTSGTYRTVVDKRESKGVSLEHIIRTSLDLDEVAQKNIRNLLAIGSKRFARELLEMLESASRAIEQNANLLRILRHHLSPRESGHSHRPDTLISEPENSDKTGKDK